MCAHMCIDHLGLCHSPWGKYLRMIGQNNKCREELPLQLLSTWSGSIRTSIELWSLVCSGGLIQKFIRQTPFSNRREKRWSGQVDPASLPLYNHDTTISHASTAYYPSFFFFLGPLLAPLLIVGSRWSSSKEAFMQYVVTSQQLRQQSMWIFEFSLGLH